MHILKYLKYITLLVGFEIAVAVPQKSYAASTVHLSELLGVEEKLKNKLLLVENSLETMKAANNLMNEDYEEYLGNPINSFSLMLRLHKDWSKWVHYASKPSRGELVHIEKAHRMRKFLPTARDLEKASQGIDDLMDFYDLKATDLAAGNLAGNSKPETALSPQDCFALAEFCVAEQKDDRAEAWFKASLAKITKQKEEKLAEQLYDFNRFRVHRSWEAHLMKQKRTTEGLHQFRQSLSSISGEAYVGTADSSCPVVVDSKYERL